MLYTDETSIKDGERVVGGRMETGKNIQKKRICLDAYVYM